MLPAQALIIGMDNVIVAAAEINYVDTMGDIIAVITQAYSSSKTGPSLPKPDIPKASMLLPGTKLYRTV
jgi:hypothetical protein